MEVLDKLSATGLPVFELNRELLESKDWSETPVGPRESWPPVLKCLINSCILPMPHCVALFWGNDLTVFHNLAWEKARGGLDGQASSATDSYSSEALSTLRVVLRGRSVKVAADFFLKDVPDGSESQLVLNAVLDENGEKRGILAQLLDNAAVERYLPLGGLHQLTRQNPVKQLKAQQTQQMRNHADTEQVDSMQTQLFQRFAELLPNGLAILDKNAEAIFVNDGFFKLTTNKSKNEFRAWPESIHEEDHDRVMSAYRSAFESRSELQIEFRCASDPSHERSGEVWRLFLLRPLSDEPDAGFISAVIDITDIKEAQLAQEKAAREAQERKEQQERFIDMVSHEIRNPLSAVLHLAEEVKEVTKEIGSTHKDLQDQVGDILDAADTILLCVSHQNTLVDDILSFSKLDSMMLSLVPREVRPKWEFSKALRVFQSEFKAKNIKFHYAMDVSYDEQNVDYVIADLNRMNQVLVNLITNAIKFTSRKDGERKIVVSMGASIKRPTSYPPNVIFFSQEEDTFHLDSTLTSEWGNGEALYLMVAVKDTGIGINQEGQEKLFERFRQATPKTQEKYGGSGLGLFISRKLCQLHGGDIGVSAKEGVGSTFGFFFRVRLSDGTSEDGRPPFQSRSNSETSNASNRAITPAPRPSYSRANSNLVSIRERQNERPGLPTVSSYSGADAEATDESLRNPPTEFMPESHPSASTDKRYEETEQVASHIDYKPPELEKELPGAGGSSQRQDKAAAEIHRSQSHQPSTNKQSLLLVEDNLINQKVLRRQLQSRGFEVFVACNGQEAVDAVVERGKTAEDDPNARNYFDCILMDQEMPVKDGNAATEEIRELQHEGMAGYSHILGVSANVREAQMKGMRDAGMDDVIAKPFKVDTLVKKIHDLISENKKVDVESIASRVKSRNSGNTKGEEKSLPIREKGVDIGEGQTKEGGEQERVKIKNMSNMDEAAEKKTNLNARSKEQGEGGDDREDLGLRQQH